MAYGDIRQLDAEQKKVINTIIRRSRRFGRVKGYGPRERRKLINTNLAVGYTESRFRNLPGGDRDSQGYRQERAMYYKNPRNLGAAVDRFNREYHADANKNASLGVRAQQVQQSGTPHVWDGIEPMVNQIRKKFSGKAGGKYRPARTTTKTIPGVDNSDLRKQLKLGYLAERGKPGGLLELASGLKQAADIPGQKVTTRTKAAMPQARQGARDSGGLTVRRDGWKGAKSVGEPLAGIAKRYGLTATSEKRGTVNTASGGVSDHYKGNRDSYAWDLSNGSAPTPEMDKAARRIARQLGVKKWGYGDLNVTKKINGRTYRFQLLYRTNTGGNHYNHIHLGIDRVDTPG